jgi:hypothetical protein
MFQYEFLVIENSSLKKPERFNKFFFGGHIANVKILINYLFLILQF